MQNATSVPVTTTANLTQTIDVGYLDVSKAHFYATEGGFTGLRYGETDYPRVSLRRALPVGQPDAYISIADADNKEIGILRDLSELSKEQYGVVFAELSRRYYCPAVESIKSVKDKLGYVYMELVIQGEGRRYEQNCAIKDVNKNIRMLDDDRLLLFDVDGNRFIVPSLSKLDSKSLKRLEPYLF